MATNFGTAAAANLFLAVSLAQAPTVSTLPTAYQAFVKHTPVRTYQGHSESFTQSVANDDVFDSASRETTAQETLIGTLRNWSLLDHDWDGEGAAKPVADSIREAVAFVRLVANSKFEDPEPMLTASGHAALFWNTADLYADIEFLGDKRIAYFVKRNSDKHKGVVSFDSENLPTVFQALLSA
jgi:hypothetical protein